LTEADFMGRSGDDEQSIDAITTATGDDGSP
jgi:hypothetical protein